jgi:nitrogen fixation/metabolism regulation signal transduction histidine kinase
MIEHVKTGIISFDPDGKVHLINDAFKGLLNKPFLQNIHGLESINMQLVDTLKDIKPNQKELLKISIKGNLLHLSIHATAFKLHDTEYKLVSFQDIKNELDAQELDAWQKLIRVLTHEIMNSVTPITSLTATLYDMVKSDLKNKDTLDISTMNNLMEGLNVILNRSNGLHRFTEAYRNLSRIPTPNFQQINIAENVRQVITLQEHNFKKVKINFKSEKDDLNINADPELLQQVLINLIKNAAEALEKVESPVIDISISRKNNECLIMVNDNGHGIPVDVLDKIFIPFYTTKKDGSGIGLPLCKQIIQLHGGKLSVRTAIQDGTTFTISL